jgi:ATP-dependent Clp protease protease subunit
MVTVPAVLETQASTTGQSLNDSVYEQLLRDRIVFLGSEVNDEVANRIIAQFVLLAADDPVKDITFYINSPGGSVTAGMAIYDTVQLVAPAVSTWGLGFAGQALPVAQHPDRHASTLSAGIADVAMQAEVFGKMKRRIADITARQTGQSVERITADADRDRWFDAEEALSYGFVDHIVGRTEKE